MIITVSPFVSEKDPLIPRRLSEEIDKPSPVSKKKEDKMPMTDDVFSDEYDDGHGAKTNVELVRCSKKRFGTYSDHHNEHNGHDYNHKNATEATMKAHDSDLPDDLEDGVPIETKTSVIERSNKLGFLPLLVMIFYSVSGGPYGVEACVRSGGNFYALVGFIIAPFVWSLPEAIMTAELSAALPEASAGVAWVQEAFGKRAGWVFGYLAWISGATDNAIYPVLFLDYLVEALPGEGVHHPVLRFCLISAVSIILAYINWLGLPIVGKMSVSICVMSMSPFIVLFLLGIWKVEPSRWFIMPLDRSEATDFDAMDDDDGFGLFPNPSLGGILWRPYLNNLFWNLNSFDATGAFAEDVHNPSQTLPKALGWAVVMVTAGYILPLLVALGASDATQFDWVDGYLAKAASDIVGPWLGAWTVFAAGISNIALFQAELSADSLALMGMAERGYLPKYFAQRSRNDTPTYALLLCTAVIVCMGATNLGKLIEMLNFNYGLSLLMEYFAFIKLRISKPDLERPFRVPLNTFGCIAFFLPTIVLTIFVLGLASYATFVVSIAVNAIFMCIYYAKERKDEYYKAYETVGQTLDEVSMTTEEISMATDEVSMTTEELDDDKSTESVEARAPI